MTIAMRLRTCKAELHIGDDHGDNDATMICDLDVGHPLPHRHEFQRDGTPVVVTFQCDQRYEECRECETPTLRHLNGGSDGHDRLQMCKSCYASVCTSCMPTHLCPCDGCENFCPGTELVERYHCHYCRACIEEGSAGGV